MAGIPWWAWIAIVAIIMWGLVTIVGTISHRNAPAEPEDAEELERLKRRVDDLEYRMGRLDR